MTLNAPTDLLSEWVRCRARSQRWIEEVLLLRREMASLMEHMENQAVVWEKRAAYSKEELTFGHESLPESVKRTLTRTYANDMVVRQGLESYALKQAHICREQGKRAAGMFKDVMREADVFIETHSVEGWELSATTPARALEDEPGWVIPLEDDAADGTTEVGHDRLGTLCSR